MKSFWMSLMAVALVGALVSGGLFAYFSDTETSTGNTFQAGTIDIKAVVQPQYVDGESSEKQVWYKDGEGRIFLDVKPCQTGYILYRITNVGMNPAEIYKYIIVDSIVNNEWVEPECLECAATAGLIDPYIDDATGKCMATDPNAVPPEPSLVEVPTIEFTTQVMWFDLKVSFDEGVSWTVIIPEPQFPGPTPVGGVGVCERLSDIIASGTWIDLLNDAGKPSLPVDGTMLVLQSFHLEPTVTNYAQSDVMDFTECFLGSQIGAAVLPSTP